MTWPIILTATVTMLATAVMAGSTVYFHRWTKARYSPEPVLVRAIPEFTEYPPDAEHPFLIPLILYNPGDVPIVVLPIQLWTRPGNLPVSWGGDALSIHTIPPRGIVQVDGELHPHSASAFEEAFPRDQIRRVEITIQYVCGRQKKEKSYGPIVEIKNLGYGFRFTWYSELQERAAIKAPRHWWWPFRRSA